MLLGRDKNEIIVNLDQFNILHKQICPFTVFVQKRERFFIALTAILIKFVLGNP